MKKILSVLLIIILSIGIVGCSSKPEGNPQTIIEEYYELIYSSDYEGAYELLSAEIKKDVDLDKFIKWNDLLASIQKDSKYKVVLLEELKDEKLDGNEFNYISKFKVNKSLIDLYSEKQEAYNNEEYVVSEDKEWKVYRLKGDFNLDKKIASCYDSRGWMYYDGKGEDLNMNAAIEMFFNAIEYDNTYFYYYYDLASALKEMNRFDEAIAYTIEAIELVGEDSDIKEDKEMLSDANNLLGVIALNEGDIEKAKGYYTLALELNSNNQYAKSNLANLE